MENKIQISEGTKSMQLPNQSFHKKPQVIHMCYSLLQLAPRSHDLSQAEKKITLKAEKIHKMTTILTQNDNCFPGQF